MEHPEIDLLYCDTSYFYALLDSRDGYHCEAKALSEETERYQIPLYASWEVVQETVTLLRYRHSFKGSRVFIDRILPNLNVVIVNNAERRKALDQFKERANEKELSLCDVLSSVIVKRRLDDSPCLAFDNDFESMGLTVIRTLS